jgi:hypothetical protein
LEATFWPASVTFFFAIFTWTAPLQGIPPRPKELVLSLQQTKNSRASNPRAPNPNSSTEH